MSRRNRIAFLTAGGGGLENFRLSTPVPVATVAPVGVTRTYSVPMWLPSDVTALKSVRVANRKYDAGSGVGAAMDVAVYQSNGSERPTGSAFAGGTFGGSGVTAPGDGTFLNLGSLPTVTRGSDGKIVLIFTFPNPTFCNVTNCYLGEYSATVSADPPPASWAGVNSGPIYWWNFGVRTGRPRYIVLGDSLSVNYDPSAAGDFFDAAWNQLAPPNNLAVNIQGVVQYGSLQNYINYAALPYLWDAVSDIMAGARVILQLGTNDVIAGRTAAQMKADLTALAARCRSFGASGVYGWSVPPSSIFGGGDVARAAYNTDIVAAPGSYGLDAVCNAAASQSAGGLADNGNPNALVAAFNVDGTHFSVAGQTQLAGKWATTLGF